MTTIVEEIELPKQQPGSEFWFLQISHNGKSFGLRLTDSGDVVGEGDLELDEAAKQFFEEVRHQTLQLLREREADKARLIV